MTDESSQNGIGHTQASFRRANEKLQAAGDAAGFVGPLPFICECSDANCLGVVNLSLEEYEDVRQHPRHFFTIPGDQQAAEAAGAARVVEQHNGYVVIEALGDAGRIAENSHGSPGS